MPAIQFHDFSYAYPGGKQALNAVQLSINRGSFTVVAGPGGAGKTTFCQAVAGVVPHYFGGSVAGTVAVDGVNTMQSGLAELAERVGTVTEDYESQLVALTVAEEVAFGLENRGVERRRIKEIVAETLALVGLAGKEELEVSSLSGGQKQRLAIAGVLAVKPDILVLDEVTSALDPDGAAEIYRLLNSLNRQQGITVIVVEHDLAKVLPYAEQFVLLVAGKVVKAGKPAEVMTYMYRRQVFTAAIPPLWQLKFMLEETTGRLANWRSEEEAITELAALLGDKVAEVKESA